MTETTERQTHYRVGDRVEVREGHFMWPYSGTVTKIDGEDEGETTYVVRRVAEEWNKQYDEFRQSDLEPSTEGFVDLDEPAQIRDEITESAVHYDKLTGMYAEKRAERIRAANRIAFLASRLAWLEATELREFVES